MPLTLIRSSLHKTTRQADTYIHTHYIFQAQPKNMTGNVNPAFIPTEPPPEYAYTSGSTVPSLVSKAPIEEKKEKMVNVSILGL